MSGLVSLNKSIRTQKVTPEAFEIAETFRRFGPANATCDIPDYRTDQYGRPTSIYGGLSIEGSGNGSHGGAAGCFPAGYRITVENYLRPQFSEYLNVPQGLQMTQSEYQNRPHYDLLGVNRSRDGVFGIDGVYKGITAPAKWNPSSDSDYLASEAWYSSQTNKVFDNRTFLNSADLQSGF